MEDNGQFYLETTDPSGFDYEKPLDEKKSMNITSTFLSGRILGLIAGGSAKDPYHLKVKVLNQDETKPSFSDGLSDHLTIRENTNLNMQIRADDKPERGIDQAHLKYLITGRNRPGTILPQPANGTLLFDQAPNFERPSRL